MSMVTESSATVIPDGTWTIDPVWSSLEFQVRKAGLVNIKGRALGVQGTIRGGSDPAIEGTVDVTSITTFDEQRDAHLQAPDFFDAARYPQLRFESDSVTLSSDGELMVEGRLTIKGITKPVELRGRFVGTSVDIMGDDRIALELETTIDRTEFGLTWNAPLPSGDMLLPNEVVLSASFAAVGRS